MVYHSPFLLKNACRSAGTTSQERSRYPDGLAHIVSARKRGESPHLEAPDVHTKVLTPFPLPGFGPAVCRGPVWPTVKKGFSDPNCRWCVTPHRMTRRMSHLPPSQSLCRQKQRASSGALLTRQPLCAGPCTAVVKYQSDPNSPFCSCTALSITTSTEERQSNLRN